MNRGLISFVEIASNPLYESGTFWAGAAVVVAIVSLVAIVWVTWRAANPKRRLWYSMPTVTPLIRKRKGLTRELKVTYGDDPLESPCSVNLQIISRGRLDIPRSAFDGEQPLQLDVGAPIFELLNVSTSQNHPIPIVKINESKVFVGPCLIGRREKIVISLLVDGDPILAPLSQSLENVDIRRGDPSEVWQRRMFGPDPYSQVLMAGGLVLSLIIFSILQFFIR